MQKKDNYLVLLYYHYTPIENPEKYREEHHQLCLSLGLRGRIIVAHEGLNGTVSGMSDACKDYMNALHSDPRFKDIDFKVEQVDTCVFSKLNIRFKKEIVHSGLHHVKPYEKTSPHLNPKEFDKIREEENTILLDVRSKYEYEMGKFKGALTMDINHFREFKEKVNELRVHKDKKIVTYCTGGVKCEKASAYLLEQGFEHIYQLHGGIIKYGIEEGGKDFEGKCYVFDQRIAIDINKINPSILSKCYVCSSESDHMVNCANTLCNRHTVICKSCMIDMQGTCSQACQDAETKRPYNMEGHYPRKTYAYNPYKCSKRLNKHELP